jgi:hypothetical protein
MNNRSQPGAVSPLGLFKANYRRAVLTNAPMLKTKAWRWRSRQTDLLSAADLTTSGPTNKELIAATTRISVMSNDRRT